MTRNRLLARAFWFTVVSLVVLSGLALVVGVPVVLELAALDDRWPLLAFLAASPVALLGGYFWLKRRVVRAGVA